MRLGDSLNTGHSANRGVFLQYRGVFLQYRGLVALYRTLGISGLQESGLNGSGLDRFTGAIMRKSSTMVITANFPMVEECMGRNLSLSKY